MTFPLEGRHSRRTTNASRSRHDAGAAEGYLAQLIGHKGVGGPLALLRRAGFAHHLSASWRTLVVRGFSFFVVAAHLTEAGERRVDEVVRTVFQYIQLVRGTTDNNFAADLLPR